MLKKEMDSLKVPRKKVASTKKVTILSLQEMHDKNRVAKEVIVSKKVFVN